MSTTSQPPSRTQAWPTERINAFVDAEYHRLYSWLARLSGNRELAADLTQETFAAFWTSLARRRVEHPARWLFRIGRNLWRKALRGQRREQHALDQLRQADASAPVERDPSQSASRTLVELVRDLPPPYCDAITLRYWCDFSYTDIGSIQRVPAALARWRVHRARTLLQRRITSEKQLLEEFENGYLTNRT